MWHDGGQQLGYGAKRIIEGQLIILGGLLIALVSLLILPMVSPLFYVYLSFDMLAPLAWLGGFVVLAGSIIAVSGAFGGPDRDPFDLFILGLFRVAAGVGVFAAAGLVHWNPTVSPLWPGPGPKPEATILALYGSVQLVTSLVIVVRSLPAILGETRRLARV